MKNLYCVMSCLRKTSGKKRVDGKRLLCVWLSRDAEQKSQPPAHTG
jgi:hypothetical protein